MRDLEDLTCYEKYGRLITEYEQALSDEQACCLNRIKYQEPNAIIVQPTKLFFISHRNVSIVQRDVREHLELFQAAT